MFSRFFINRPIFATVISFLIVIAGIISIQVLPVKEYPSVAPPQINIRAVYPGADAGTLSKTISSVLENAVNGVENMTYMSSTAAPSGTLSMSVYFKVGTDVDQAKVDINNRVQLAMSSLPEEVQRQGISVTERSPDMLKVIAFSSSNAEHSRVYISNYLSVNIVDELKRLNGVGDVVVFGQSDYSIRLWVDPGKLEYYNLSVTDVRAQVASQNNQYPAGSIGAEPLSAKTPFTYVISTESRFKTVAEFEDIIIRSNEDGSTLRLKDIARVELGSNANNVNSTYNKKTMVPTGIFLSSGANALEVSDAVDAKLEELKSSFPEGLGYDMPYDTSVFVNASIQEVLKTLAEAVIFVTILIYLFLGNLRATIIPVLAIPVSLIGTFAGFYAAGFSINLLTLFGLILAIGLVVDDAIIVIENVERVLRTKKTSVKDATLEAMKELTTPIIAIVLVISAVFIPASLSGGFSGVMYQQFAITIVMAVVISGLVALTLTPALCAIFLRADEPEPIWPIRKFNQFFDWSTKVFIGVTKQTIKLWFFSILLFGGLLYTTYATISKLPSGLVPTEDKGVLLVIQNMMPATALSESTRISNGIIDTFSEKPDVVGVASITGIDLTTFSNKTDAGVMFLKLKPWDERPLASQSSQNLARQYFMEMMQNKDAFVIPVNPPPISGMNMTGGFEMWIQDKTGGEISTLNTYVQEIIAKASTDSRITGIRTTLNTNVPQYSLSIDREKAKSMGVSVGSIYATLQSTFGQGYINDFNLYGRTYKVNIQSDAEYRMTKENYKDVYVRSSAGDLVPVSTLINIKRIVSASIIQRFNMFNAAYITGNPGAGFSSGDARAAIEEIANNILPQGYSVAWAGTSLQEKQLETKGNTAPLFAAVFIFLILAALYESWSIPMAVILSIPFAIFGAALAVMLRGLESDVYFQVGLVTLVGLSAKNAILIVEFAMEKLKSGMSLFDATVEAARLRFRPIVMTSLAFIVGTLPLALSTGAGSASRHIIGTTVVGGMAFATTVGILFIPLFFYLVLKIKEKMSRKKI